MSQIMSNPFYQASHTIHSKILSGVNQNLDALTNSYNPSADDNKLFFPYGNEYALNNMVMFFHSQFFFDIGKDLLEEVTVHEIRIGKEICKEAILAVMAVSCIMKNDVLNYRVYLERMMQQRRLYDPSSPNLITLISNEPVFGSVKREAERVFDVNVFIQKLKSSLYTDISFSGVASTLTSLYQAQFVNYVLNYRLLHYYLIAPNCPDIVYEHSYSLIQNLCVLFESQLKINKSSVNLLGKLLSQDINVTYRTHYTTTLSLQSTYPTNNIATFNTHLPNVIAALDIATTDLDTVVYCSYIAYMCRNQVLHNISDTVIFHGDPILTEKIIGILLTSIYFMNKL